MRAVPLRHPRRGLDHYYKTLLFTKLKFSSCFIEIHFCPKHKNQSGINLSMSLTSAVNLLRASHSSDTVNWKLCVSSSCTFQMRSPAGEIVAPGGPVSSWKSRAEPSGSVAVNWYTKFSPKKVCRPSRGLWKVGGRLAAEMKGEFQERILWRNRRLPELIFSCQMIFYTRPITITIKTTV